MKSVYKSDNFEFYSVDPSSTHYNIKFGGEVVAGFPSPADDFPEHAIDLFKTLIKHPDATFYVRVKGNSMCNDFNDGDLLVVDRSLDWSDDKIALCYVNNEFTLKRIKIKGDKCYLIPSNKDYPMIEVNDNEDVYIWGIVVYSIKKH